MIEILNGIVETVAYTGMNGVRVYHNDLAEDYPVHWHTALELIMPISESYSVEVNNERYTFGAGDIFLIPPGELHALFAPPSGERIIMLIDYSLLCNLNGMDALLRSLHPYRLVRVSEEPALAERLKNYLVNLEKEYFEHAPYSEARIYSLLLSFFVFLGRESHAVEAPFSNFASGKQHEYVEKFMKVCNYISDHCTEEISVEQLADIAGFSRFHFARLFKQFTGISYYDYLTRKRIEHAEQLLITPDISITEVAMHSGFNSLSTFNRVFKALKNCTPSEYKGLNNTNQYEKKKQQE